MEKRPSISVGQIFSMLFISRMVVSMTYGTLLIGDSDIWDHLISAPISFLLTFLLVYPVYRLFLMDEKMNVIDNAYSLMGRWGMCIILIYVIYYLVISVHILSVFNNFISNAVNPPISLSLLSIVLLMSCCYAAYKGLESLARTSSFILCATIISIFFLTISLLSSIEKINFTPFMYNGNESVTEGIFYMISQSSCIPAMAMLLPMGKGTKWKGILIWNSCIYVVFSLIIVLIIGSMGDFTYTQLFPVYTAAGTGKFGSFRHLDAMYLGVWILGIFLKLSLFIVLASEGIKKILGEKASKYSVIIFGALLMLPTFFPNLFSALKSSAATTVLFYFVILTSVVFPIILIILKKLRIRKEHVI